MALLAGGLVRAHAEGVAGLGAVERSGVVLQGCPVDARDPLKRSGERAGASVLSGRPAVAVVSEVDECPVDGFALVLAERLQERTADDANRICLTK